MAASICSAPSPNPHDNVHKLSLLHSTKPLFLQISYTWSRSIDQSSSLAEAIYPGNAGNSRALSAFDLTHNFVVSYRYALPVIAFSPAFRSLSKAGRSGLTRFSTGFPVTLVNNNNTPLLGTQPNGINNYGVDEPNFSGGNLTFRRRPEASPILIHAFSPCLPL